MLILERLKNNYILTGQVSPDYIISEWEDYKALLDFIDYELKLCRKQDGISWESNLRKYYNSAAPIDEKIVYFNDLMVDVKLVNKKLQTNELSSRIDFLKSLIKKLKTQKSSTNFLKTQYRVSDDLKIEEIYDVIESTINCEFPVFLNGIEAANFKNLNIKRQNVVQDLTYRLSALMGTVWYTDVCTNMKWKKSICSGQGQKLEMDLIIRILDKKLPRPKRK